MNGMSDGDTLILNPGSYFADNITISQNITIEANTAIGGSPANTVIHGAYMDRIFIVVGGHNLTINNLDLENGVNGQFLDSIVHLNLGSVVVSSSIIQKNEIGIIVSSNIPGPYTPPAVTSPNLNVTPTPTLWIQIDPIPGQVVPANVAGSYTGNFFINGTTNLPSGTVVNIGMDNDDMPPCPMHCWESSTYAFVPCSCGGTGYSSTTKVMENSEGNNTWSFFINTSSRLIGPAINDFNDVAVEVSSDGVDDHSQVGFLFVDLPETPVPIIAVPSNTSDTAGEGVPSLPAPDFISDIRSGIFPLTVQFIDTSSGNPVSWKWSFGDNTYSTDQNPIHTYTKVGTYSVSLTATNTEGRWNSLIKMDYINVSYNPVQTWIDKNGVFEGMTAEEMLQSSPEYQTNLYGIPAAEAVIANLTPDMNAPQQVISEPFILESGSTNNSVQLGSIIQYTQTGITHVYDGQGHELYFIVDNESANVTSPSGTTVPATHLISVPNLSSIWSYGNNKFKFVTIQGLVVLSIVNSTVNNQTVFITTPVTGNSSSLNPTITPQTSSPVTMTQTMSIPTSWLTANLTPSPTSPITTPRSGLDEVPIFGTLGLCGVIFLFWNNRN